jgi:hypothetical protein
MSNNILRKSCGFRDKQNGYYEHVSNLSYSLINHSLLNTIAIKKRKK